MTDIQKNILSIKTELGEGVRLLAVSKTYPIENILTAYKIGQRDFAENKVQELCEKREKLVNYDIIWHLIGHLQTNKVKYIAPFVDYIHSVDSLKLLIEINKQAQKLGRSIKCLFEFYIASEETKFGLTLQEAERIINSEEYKKMENIEICGVMAMASFSNNEELIRTEFKKLKKIFYELKKKYYFGISEFREISMGMSSDWKIAIEEGTTMIRIGSNIFGKRNYNN